MVAIASLPGGRAGGREKGDSSSRLERRDLARGVHDTVTTSRGRPPRSPRARALVPVRPAESGRERTGTPGWPARSLLVSAREAQVPRRAERVACLDPRYRPLVRRPARGLAQRQCAPLVPRHARLPRRALARHRRHVRRRPTPDARPPDRRSRDRRQARRRRRGAHRGARRCRGAIDRRADKRMPELTECRRRERASLLRRLEPPLADAEGLRCARHHADVLRVVSAATSRKRPASCGSRPTRS